MRKEGSTIAAKDRFERFPLLQISFAKAEDG